MGPRDVVLSGSFAIDSNILIYTIEQHPAYLETLQQLWFHCDLENRPPIISALAVTECLVAPIRSGMHEFVRRYEEHLHSSSVMMVEISTPILRRAAQLRADNKSLRTPDAIHLATALENRCSTFLTNDLRLAPIDNLRMLQLSSLL